MDNKEDGFTKEVLEYPCSGFILDIFFNELDDASCKICIFRSIQSRNNGKIFKLRVQMLDNHDNDAHLRWMIAMLV